MRYLDPYQKMQTIAEWHQLRADAPAPLRPDYGGRGYPDPRIIPTVDSLNALPGICTISSCSGHDPHEAESGGEYDGHLWIRIDRDVFDIFAAHAWTLSGKRNIWWLRIQFDRVDGPVVQIEFPRGECASVCATVLNFFRHITKLADTLRRDKERWRDPVEEDGKR